MLDDHCNHWYSHGNYLVHFAIYRANANSCSSHYGTRSDSWWIKWIEPPPSTAFGGTAAALGETLGWWDIHVPWRSFSLLKGIDQSEAILELNSECMELKAWVLIDSYLKKNIHKFIVFCHTGTWVPICIVRVNLICIFSMLWVVEPGFIHILKPRFRPWLYHPSSHGQERSRNLFSLKHEDPGKNGWKRSTLKQQHLWFVTHLQGYMPQWLVCVWITLYILILGNCTFIGLLEKGHMHGLQLVRSWVNPIQSFWLSNMQLALICFDMFWRFL